LNSGALTIGRALALYTRLKTAEIAGLLPERDIRRLLGMFEEVERMMENYLRAQAKAEEARKTVPQARSRWQPHPQDGSHLRIAIVFRLTSFSPHRGGK